MPKPKFGDEAYPRDRQLRAHKIRSQFHGSSIPTYTDQLIADGLWSAGELSQRASRSCQAEVRDALKAPQENGMPFAAPTVEIEAHPAERLEEDDDGRRGRPARVWQQLELLSEEDGLFNYREERCSTEGDVRSINRWARWLRDRFGRGPADLELREIDGTAQEG